MINEILIAATVVFSPLIGWFGMRWYLLKTDSKVIVYHEIVATTKEHEVRMYETEVI